MFSQTAIAQSLSRSIARVPATDGLHHMLQALYTTAMFADFKGELDAQLTYHARSTGPLPRIMRVDRERTMCPDCAQLHQDFEWTRHSIEVSDKGECHIPYHVEELIEPWLGACEFCGDSDEVTHIVSTLTRYIAR